MKILHPLTSCQKKALKQLQSGENVFLSGVAGSGKTYLIQAFIQKTKRFNIPILASTGIAAIINEGRTFHSFFGLGIMQGGYEATVNRAVKNTRVTRRLIKVKCLVIDEVSMLPGVTLQAAEEICRIVKESDAPWGGIQIIVVGDFAQLPPVTRSYEQRDWAFLSDVWQRSHFQPIFLNTIVRTKSKPFLQVLKHIREGEVNETVTDFLNLRSCSLPDDFDGTRLFPRRHVVESYNLDRLHQLDGPITTFNTSYKGDPKFIETLKKQAPIPEQLHLKRHALVMLRKNDTEGRWVNGSIGTVKDLGSGHISVKLLNGITIFLEQTTFSLLNADGKEMASASNYPLNLTWATTIHKAQGLTLDRVFVDLEQLWEPGQAYVALSRTQKPEDLFVANWSASSIRRDAEVALFYQNISP